MKYAMVVPKEFKMHYEHTPFEISGLLNWARAMKGDVVTVDDDLSQYDILHCNLSSTEINYPYKCRMENPDAVIVGNLDFAIDVLQQYFSAIEGEVPTKNFPSSYLLDTIKSIDIVLSVEPTQSKWLNMMVGDVKTIHHVPHPTDVAAVLGYVNKIPPVEHDPTVCNVAVEWHQYEHNHILPLQILNAAQRKLDSAGNKITLVRKLMGVKPKFCTEGGIRFPVQSGIKLPAFMQDLVALGMPHLIPLHSINGNIEFINADDGCHYWDDIVPYLAPMEFYQELIKSDVALDLYTIFSLGRFQMDSAICSVPSVVSDRSYSGNRLYPYTSVSLREPGVIVEKLVELISDEEHRDEVTNYASDHLYEFDLEACCKILSQLVQDFLK